MSWWAACRRNMEGAPISPGWEPCPGLSQQPPWSGQPFPQAQDSYYAFGCERSVGTPMCSHSSGPQQGSQKFPYPYFMQISGPWRRQLRPSIIQWMKQGEANVTKCHPRKQMEKELARKRLGTGSSRGTHRGPGQTEPSRAGEGRPRGRAAVGPYPRWGPRPQACPM